MSNSFIDCGSGDVNCYKSRPSTQKRWSWGSVWWNDGSVLNLQPKLSALSVEGNRENNCVPLSPMSFWMPVTSNSQSVAGNVGFWLNLTFTKPEQLSTRNCGGNNLSSGWNGKRLTLVYPCNPWICSSRSPSGRFRSVAFSFNESIKLSSKTRRVVFDTNTAIHSLSKSTSRQISTSKRGGNVDGSR